MSGLTIVIVIGSLPLIGLQHVGAGIHPPTEPPTGQVIPLQTDDGLDPINLVFTGYAPSWWVAANMAGWSDSAYCSGPKTVSNLPYNYTLEHPDPTGQPCIGPRDHIRIWDRGYSSTFGEWSVASAHHEHTVCNPVCHHVIDSWTKPQTDTQSSFFGQDITLSMSNYTLGSPREYQNVTFSGNATMIQLKPPYGTYPIVFTETGLGNHTSWSVNLNGTTQATLRPDVVFDVTNGTYPFTVGIPAHFSAIPSSGMIKVNGGLMIQKVQFQLIQTAVPYWEYAVVGALATAILGVAFTVISLKRGSSSKRQSLATGTANRFHNA